MQNHFRSNGFGYLFAVVTSGIAGAMASWTGGLSMVLLQVIAVLVGSWSGGLYPGLLATALCAITDIYFFLEPHGVLAVDDQREVLSIVLFITTGVAISVVNETKKTAYGEANSRRQELQLVMSSIGDGVIATDLNNRVVSMNPVAEQLTGREQSLVIGQPLSVVLPLESFPAGSLAVESQGSQRTQSFQGSQEPEEISSIRNIRFMQLQAAEGTRIPIEITTTPIMTRNRTVRGAVLVFRDVTARLEAEHRLKENEQRYELVSEAANDAIWDWDLANNQVLWNFGLHQLFQYPVEFHITSGDWWLERVHPSDRLRIDQGIQQVCQPDNQQEDRWYAEYRFQRADGTYAFVMDRGQILRDRTGQAVRMVGSMLDLTERRQIEQAMAERTRLADLRADISFCLATGNQLNAVLQQCAESITLRLQACSTRIWLINEHSSQLELTAGNDAEGQPVQVMDQQIQELFPLEQIARQGLPVTGKQSPTTELRPEAKTEILGKSEKQVQDFAGFPLLVEGNVLGVLGVFFAQSLSDVALKDLAPLADTIAQYIQRKRNAEQLQEQEQQYRSIFEGSNDSLMIFDAQGILVEANQTACHLYGYTYEEFIGLAETELFRSQESASSQRFCEHTLSGDSFSDQGAHLKKDGTPIYVEVQGSGLIYRGRPHLLVVVRDVSERRQTEIQFLELTNESERQRRLYDTILSNSLDQIYVFDLDYRYCYVNQALLNLWGKTWEQAIGKNFQELGYPDEQARKHREEIDRVIRTGQPIRGETPYTGATGRRIYDYIFYPVLGLNGEVEAVAGTSRDVTERNITENNLRQSENRFRQLADAMPPIIWTATPNGYIDYYNNRWYEYTGFEMDQRGEACWEQILHPEDLQNWKSAWQHCVEQGTSFEIEFRLWDYHTNCYEWFLGRAVSAKDGYGDVMRWYGTCTNITRQKRNEQISEFLAYASSRLVEHFAPGNTMNELAHIAVPDFADWCAIDMLSPDGQSRRVALVHAAPAPDSFATDIAEIYPPEFDANGILYNVLRTRSSQLIFRLTDEEPVSRKTQRPDVLELQNRWLHSCLCVPLVLRDRILGVITYAMAHSGRQFDTNDLQAAEYVASRITVAMENTTLYQQLQESDQRKDEFLAMLAHELRNPLAPIRNGLELLLLDNPEDRAVLEVMRDQVEHLVRLVDDLLDVSRIMQGKIGLQKQNIEMHDILQRAIAAVNWNFLSKQQTFKTQISDQPMPIYGDPVRLVQVISNLLNNASKYTEIGGTIELSAEPQDDQVVIRVLDNGIGIELELLPQVFDLFIQSSRALDRAQGGLGIGLTLVRNILDLHDGKVAVFSDGPGTGSEFLIELPLLQQTEQSGLPGPHNADTAQRGLRILVVDDNIGAAQLLSLLLAKLGSHKIEKAHDGFATLEKLETYEPDLILLDIGLPEMDGYEVARRIRQIPRFANTLLVALTGYGREEDRKLSREAGFDEHLVKPPALDILRELLQHPRLTIPAESSPKTEEKTDK